MWINLDSKMLSWRMSGIWNILPSSGLSKLLKVCESQFPQLQNVGNDGHKVAGGNK